MLIEGRTCCLCHCGVTGVRGLGVVTARAVLIWWALLLLLLNVLGEGA